MGWFRPLLEHPSIGAQYILNRRWKRVLRGQTIIRGQNTGTRHTRQWSGYNAISGIGPKNICTAVQVENQPLLHVRSRGADEFRWHPLHLKMVVEEISSFGKACGEGFKRGPFLLNRTCHIFLALTSSQYRLKKHKLPTCHGDVLPSATAEPTADVKQFSLFRLIE